MFLLDKFYTDLIDKYKECDFSFIPIEKLEPREKEYFKKFMPDAKNIIVVYYQVKNLKDWTWNCPDGNILSERCDINDLANEVCQYIQETLIKNNFPAKIIPYPQTSGLQFRFVAKATGYGEIGKNCFYLHPDWGSRVHLRVLASEIKSDLLCSIKLKTNKVCLNCEKCIKICPANAFENGFDGLKCREFRKKRGEYIPFGTKGLLRYCTKCLTVCKAGNLSQFSQKNT